MINLKDIEINIQHISKVSHERIGTSDTQDGWVAFIKIEDREYYVAQRAKQEENMRALGDLASTLVPALNRLLDKIVKEKING